jgi:hypothetical protein
MQVTGGRSAILLPFWENAQDIAGLSRRALHEIPGQDQTCHVQLKACRGSAHTVPVRTAHVVDRKRFRSETMTGETK